MKTTLNLFEVLRNNTSSHLFIKYTLHFNPLRICLDWFFSFFREKTLNYFLYEKSAFISFKKYVWIQLKKLLIKKKGLFTSFFSKVGNIQLFKKTKAELVFEK